MRDGLCMQRETEENVGRRQPEMNRFMACRQAVHAWESKLSKSHIDMSLGKLRMQHACTRHAQ